MAHIPFILGLDTPVYYGHDTFPNRMYRRLHPRHHDPLDMHTLGLIARLGPHAHHLAAAQRNGELVPLGNKGKENFEVHLDVGLFEPEELSVKIANDSIVVEGKHEEREDDHGHVSRHFIRRYKVPVGYNCDAIESTLSTDGVLTVKVPKLQEDKAVERVVQIKQIGPSDLFLKNGDKDAKDDKVDKVDKEAN